MESDPNTQANHNPEHNLTAKWVRHEMNGREKIAAALSAQGTGEIPAVICYEDIYIRDHWPQLTASPWWDALSPDIERQMCWRREVITKTGQDWFVLPAFYSREERESLSLDVRADGVYRYDRRYGKPERLAEPRIGGWSAVGQPESTRPIRLATGYEEIAALVPAPEPMDHDGCPDDGREDLAACLMTECGESLYPFCHVSSPLWRGYSLWGFEGLMLMIASRPDAVRYACERFLAQGLGAVRDAAARGAAGIWIEECMTDMISPQDFRALNLSFLRPLVEEIRGLGMQSIYYYCGNPGDRWGEILSSGADALSLEESKKGFIIDINDVVDRVQGHMAVLGNLDAIDLLPHAREDALRAEICRQIAAGRRNRGRFVMSLGSPVTPGTSVDRVRLYCDLVHALG